MSVTSKFARQIADRDGGWNCHYCGIALIPLGQLHIYGIPDGQGSYFTPDDMDCCVVDHIQAKSRGGQDEPSNLVLSCGGCNTRKGAMDYHAFIGKIRR